MAQSWKKDSNMNSEELFAEALEYERYAIMSQEMGDHKTAQGLRAHAETYLNEAVLRS